MEAQVFSALEVYVDLQVTAQLRFCYSKGVAKVTAAPKTRERVVVRGTILDLTEGHMPMGWCRGW
jgi:hypothetical protein